MSEKRQKKTTGRLLREKRGDTIVEVIVAFAIVLFSVVTFTAGVSASVRLYRKAAAALSQSREMDAWYYQQEEEDASAQPAVLLMQENGAGGEKITLNCQVLRFLYPETEETRYYVEADINEES